MMTCHDYDMHKIYDHLAYAKMKNLILDTDTFNEIDDQFAVTYAMVADDINILAMTAAPFYNRRSTGPADGMEKSYHELIKIRNPNDPEGKRNIPVYRGSASYMKNIITPVKSEAAEAIVRKVHEADGIVYIAAIGCYTNVASALLLDPTIMDKAVVILTGGQKIRFGSANEFNLEQDRIAARVIFECGVPVIVLPASGCTEELYATNAEVEYYLRDKAGKIGNYLCDIFNAEEGHPMGKDNFCNTRQRSIFDIASIAFMRNPVGFCNKHFVSAHSITPSGDWFDLKDGREMIIMEDIGKYIVLSDFFTLVRRANE